MHDQETRCMTRQCCQSHEVLDFQLAITYQDRLDGHESMADPTAPRPNL
jgi:hypothetical protein